ncbi:DedA family protein [Zavarzinella formosa]|uniref:DedA family protein n=1 Tax=Zavarzinella formosa TaxID=360055 RepID=UPI0002D60329|nr:DedA family protein [Zavarzinella formosa]
MISWNEILQYLSIAGMLMASGVGAPIPEEIPIATAGIMVGRVWDNPGGMHWWIMLPVCIVSVVACDSMLYYFGRRWGGWLIQRKWVQKRVLPPDRRLKIEKNFHDYGIGILLIARLLPGIRAPVFMTAGMIRLPFRKFLLADGLYAIPGVNLIFWLAFVFADSFIAILNKLDTYRELVLIAVISYVAGFATSAVLKRRGSAGDPNEIPVVGKTVVMVHSHLTGEHKQHDEPKPVVEKPVEPKKDMGKPAEPWADLDKPTELKSDAEKHQEFPPITP